MAEAKDTQTPAPTSEKLTFALRALQQTGALAILLVVVWRLFDFIEKTCIGGLPN